MYRDCKAVMRTDDWDIHVELQRGVDQGDPLAPLVFNLIIEPMLEEIQSETKGIKIGVENVSIMAFDIVTTAYTSDTTQIQVMKLVDSFSKLGIVLFIG